jgi:hypothetical protein
VNPPTLGPRPDDSTQQDQNDRPPMSDSAEAESECWAEWSQPSLWWSELWWPRTERSTAEWKSEFGPQRHGREQRGGTGQPDSW